MKESKKAGKEAGNEKQLQLAILSARRAQQASERLIAGEFIRALNGYDAQKIVEIATAVLFLKGKIPLIDAPKFQDRTRAFLVLLKFQLEQTGIKMTDREVTQFVTREKNPIKEKIDAIRDMCIEIGFPRKQTRKIRKK